MAITDKEISKLDDAIDNLVIQIYKEKKLPQKTTVLENPSYMKELEEHTSEVKTEAKKKLRSLAKSDPARYSEYKILRDEILKDVKTKYLNDQKVKDLQNMVMITLEDQAASLGIDDINDPDFADLVDRLAQNVFQGADEISLTELKANYNYLLNLKRDIDKKISEIKRGLPDPDDSDDLEDLDTDVSDSLYRESNELYSKR
jgi:hypothetical protein